MKTAVAAEDPDEAAKRRELLIRIATLLREPFRWIRKKP